MVPALSGIAQAPFHRYVNRCLLILALAGLWPLARALGLRTLEDVGLTRFDRRAGREWCAGFGIGWLMLAGVAGIALAAGARRAHLDPDSAVVLRHLLNASASAMIVSVIEEILFRGAVFGALRRVQPWPQALIWSSAIYALVHFLDRPPAQATVEWWSGLATLGSMLAGFGDWQRFIPGFLSLTLAGILLGLAYQSTGRLWASIGLHAGWVFWLKGYGFFSREIEGSAVWLWGTRRMIDGWTAFVLLAAAVWMAGRLSRSHTQPTVNK